MAQNGSAPSRGIRYWMDHVVTESANACDGMKAGPVHDLRVAIRRCRSIAEGFVAIDPHPAWKKMRKAAKPLFSALGDLRDVQVQMEWVDKLCADEDPVHQKLLQHFTGREKELQSAASAALAAFDIQQWQSWAAVLEQRSQMIAAGSEVFQLMALERWQQARDLHTVAMRNRSKMSLHALRIGLKKFRYIVENFLPQQHDTWINDLKHLQDLLGDIHDLDVLWDTARQIRAFASPQEREQWLRKQKRERQQRLDEYRKHMIGRQTLWSAWREELPQGDALHLAIQRYFETWVFLRDHDLSHTHRVLQWSLRIFDSLVSAKAIRLRDFDGLPTRELLSIAAFTHASAEGKRHKRIVKELEKQIPPPGWKAIHLQIVGLVARFHRGPLPGSQTDYVRLRQSAKNVVNLLAGILRIAEALDIDHDGKVLRVNAALANTTLFLDALGYEERTRQAEQIARARHLLESILRISILVRPMDDQEHKELQP
jgi:exopolyphosphatase/guanosine-5'-triphosphate,3'-diphosphate pyrophosphatase